MSVDAERTWKAPWRLRLLRTLRPLRRGFHDPCHVEVGEATLWRTSRQPSGVALACLQQRDEHTVHCRAWGPGAQEFVDGLPALCGEDDAHHEFDSLGHEIVDKLHRAHAWLRMPRTNLVFEELPGAILEQRVMAVEAFSSRGWLVRRFGEAPPASPEGMPKQLRVVPSPEAWRSVPSWDWHRAGVDVHRAETLLRCANAASRLDEVARLDRFSGTKRLRAVRGVGVWTAAEVRQRALGDPDAVSYGDVHLARFVGYALTGAEVDDHGMERLLEPWTGHRHRVVRLLHLGAGLGAVRTAPKIAPPRRRQHLRF